MLFSSVEKPPRLSEFELEIPEKLIADHPSKTRDGCKLMVLDTKEETITHRKFSNIIDYLKKGDVDKARFFIKDIIDSLKEVEKYTRKNDAAFIALKKGPFLS